MKVIEGARRLLTTILLLGIAVGPIYAGLYIFLSATLSHETRGLVPELALPMQLVLSILPYAIGGLLLYRLRASRSQVVASTLVITVVERCAILVSAAVVVAGAGPGWQSSASSLFPFIQREALPHFTPIYALAFWLVSIAAAMAGHAMMRRIERGPRLRSRRSARV